MADVTVTRLAARPVPGRDRAGFVASDLGWLRPHEASRHASLGDVSDEFATIGLWGPLARDILAAAAG